MSISYRFPSLGLTFCPECGVELDPNLESYKTVPGEPLGKIEYTNRFHNSCPNSDKRFLGTVDFVECSEINSQVN